MRKRPLAERTQLLLFFPLTLIAWAIWWPQAANRLGLLSWTVPVQSPLNFLTVWAPGLAAMLVSALVAGGSGVSALFSSLRRWRLPVVWYLLALLFEPLRWAVAFTVDRIAGQSYELGGPPILQALGPSAAFMAPVALLLTLPNALGEELGWRAFALPRLQQWKGPLVASLVLGLFWGVWHVPMWIAGRAGDPAWLTLMLMAVNMVPMTVLYTFLFNRTGGSLPLVCLFHASSAIKGYLLPSLPTATQVTLLWLAAAGVVVFGGFLRRAVAAREPAASREAA